MHHVLCSVFPFFQATYTRALSNSISLSLFRVYTARHLDIYTPLQAAAARTPVLQLPARQKSNPYTSKSVPITTPPSSSISQHLHPSPFRHDTHHCFSLPLHHTHDSTPIKRISTSTTDDKPAPVATHKVVAGRLVPLARRAVLVTDGAGDGVQDVVALFGEPVPLVVVVEAVELRGLNGQGLHHLVVWWGFEHVVLGRGVARRWSSLLARWRVHGGTLVLAGREETRRAV